jgi:UDP-N-acetylmuramate--alanine ligase
VLVVDDYGHHPTEVRATLAAAKLGSGGRRIVVLFQPHRYTRTHDLMQEFARSFNNADVLFISDIYAASEDPIEGVTSEALTNAIKRFGHKEVSYIGDLENAALLLRDYVQPGDLVVTLGAGTVNRISDQLVGLLREQVQSKSVG